MQAWGLEVLCQEPRDYSSSLTAVMMPDGVDAVAMHEFCEFDETGNTVRIGSALKPGSNNRPAGENLRSGELIVAAGTRLTAADIGIAAAAGHGALQVRRRLRVGLLSMGDEVVAAGAPTGHGQIHDSNRPMLAAMLSNDGFEVVDLGIVPDDEAALSSCFAKALESCDAVLSSGGASDGDEDHTQAAMRNNDVEPVFWRLSIKPGRPMAGGIRSGKPVMCVPGNPVAAFVCYRLAAAPVLDRMAGGIARPLLRPRVKCGFDHRKSAGRAEYLRVKVSNLCRSSGKTPISPGCANIRGPTSKRCPFPMPCRPSAIWCRIWQPCPTGMRRR